MALSEERILDKIEIIHTEYGYPKMHIRYDAIINRDDIEVSRIPERYYLLPDADLTEEDSDVKKVAATVFTAQVKAAYQEYLDSLTPKIVAEAVE